MLYALGGALLAASLLARASATVRRQRIRFPRRRHAPTAPALTSGRAGIDVPRLHRLHGARCSRAVAAEVSV
jgi:hypothetical protein